MRGYVNNAIHMKSGQSVVNLIQFKFMRLFNWTIELLKLWFPTDEIILMYPTCKYRANSKHTHIHRLHCKQNDHISNCNWSIFIANYATKTHMHIHFRPTGFRQSFFLCGRIQIRSNNVISINYRILYSSGERTAITKSQAQINFECMHVACIVYLELLNRTW